MAEQAKRLPLSFYRRDDVIRVAQDLVGQVLVSDIQGKRVSGRIVETEAYRGWGDRACHAHAGKMTPRNQVMFRAGGIAYVYLCYGVHHLFNVVTNQAGSADAVLIRAVEPLEGVSFMAQRRGLDQCSKQLANGPGKLTQAMGIEVKHNGVSLTGDEIWISKSEITLKPTDLISSPRMGVDYAGEDAKLPWRFRLRGSRYTSPKE